MGKFVTIPAAGGGKKRAYVAAPAKGSGPGIVVLQEIFGVNANIREICDLYAAEGYVAMAPDLFWRLEKNVDLGYGDADFKHAFDLYGRFDVARGVRDIAAAVKALRKHPKQAGRVGALGFCLGGKLAWLAAAHAGVDCAVSYYGVGIETELKLAAKIKVPMVLHFGGADKFVPPAAVARIRKALAKRPGFEIYEYPGCDHAFASRGRPQFDRLAAGMAHSRALALFRRTMGPHFNLSALWEEHCYQEFAARDVPATMKTMVADPYVNHIPTMTGGVGAAHLARFYQHHFVNVNPADTKLVPVSRTIGADRVVDEMLFCFTHDREMDFMLPGVKPTGKYVEVPTVAIVGFRGDKIWHEHIYWDQASVLVQIGLLDPAGLPVAGIETAKKLVDETRPSNALMARWAKSAGKPIG